MESKQLILSIYNVSEYLYCQRSCFYKIYAFEEKQDENIDIIKGRTQHKIVHSNCIRYKSNIKQLTNVSVFSHKYGIRGKLDLLEIQNNTSIEDRLTKFIYIPVEYKKGKYRDFLNHKIQLCLQVLCLEDMYKTNIFKAYLYFIEEKRRYKINIDDDLRKIAINTINEIRKKINDPKLFKKNCNELCPRCSFYQTCMPEIK